MSNSRLVTKPKPVRVERKSWRDIILEVLRGLPEGPVRLAALYDAVEAHPEAIIRAATNAHMHAKTRQVLQRLRDEGLVKAVEKGVWKLTTS